MANWSVFEKPKRHRPNVKKKLAGLAARLKRRLEKRGAIPTNVDRSVTVKV
jgi:hypothetical protein